MSSLAFLVAAYKRERMIDVLIDGERHVRVGAVDRTGGRVDQVLDAVVAAPFDDVQKAGHIAVDVDMRIVDRMAHARLRGEMDHAVEFLGREQGLDTAAIGQIQLYEVKILVPLQYFEPRTL